MKLAIEDGSLEYFEKIVYGMNDREVGCPYCGNSHCLEMDVSGEMDCHECGKAFLVKDPMDLT